MEENKVYQPTDTEWAKGEIASFGMYNEDGGEVGHEEPLPSAEGARGG